MQPCLPSRSLTITTSRNPFLFAAQADLAGAAPPPHRKDCTSATPYNRSLEKRDISDATAAGASRGRLQVSVPQPHLF
jgi:hypothetical protein